MSDRSVDTGTVADAYLALLADRGVDYFFANAGTDFTPLIEAFAKAAALNLPAPKPIAVPHENVAMALAMATPWSLAGRKWSWCTPMSAPPMHFAKC